MEKSFLQKMKDKISARSQRMRVKRNAELSPDEAFKKTIQENAARIEKNKPKPKKKLFGGTDTGWSNQDRNTFGSGSSFPMFLGATEPESGLGIDYQNPDAGVVSQVEYLNEKKS